MLWLSARAKQDLCPASVSKNKTQSAEVGKVKVPKSTSVPPQTVTQDCAAVHHAALQMLRAFKGNRGRIYPSLRICCCLQIHVNSFYHLSPYPGESRNNKREAKALSCTLQEMLEKVFRTIGWGGGLWGRGVEGKQSGRGEKNGGACICIAP